MSVEVIEVRSATASETARAAEAFLRMPPTPGESPAAAGKLQAQR